MARRPSTLAARRAQIRRLLEASAPEIQRAFLDAINTIKSEARLAEIVRFLEAGRIDQAVESLGISRAVFSAYDRALSSAYTQAGELAASQIPPVRQANGIVLNVHFDGRDTRSAAFVNELVGRKIDDIVSEQKRMLIRAVGDAVIDGRPPATVAIDMVGRLSRATGRREGGFVGLSDYYADRVRDARRELAGAFGPRGGNEGLRNYLERTLRDRRFDRYVERALKDGTTIPEQLQRRMIERYEDRMLQYRAQTIARTESLTALNVARNDQYAKLVEQGAIRPEQVRRTWRDSADRKVRDSHVAVSGETVGMNETYSNGLAYPHDPNGPAEEVINCRCWEDIRIDFLSNIPGVE